MADARPHPSPGKTADGERLHRLEPDPATSAVVQRIFAEFIAGTGLHLMDRDGRFRGDPATGARPWLPDRSHGVQQPGRPRRLGLRRRDCPPLRSATTGSSLSAQPAIAGGVACTGSAEGTVHVFRAEGGGSAICAPLWTAWTGSAITEAPAVTSGQLYVGTADGRVIA